MTLTSVAYLEVEGTDSTATFQLQIDYNNSSNGSKEYVMGGRGIYLSQVINQVPELDFGIDKRTGWWIDGGAGNWQETVNFSVGQEGVDYQWGDDSGSRDQSGVTKTDASGSGVDAISRKNILDYWLARSKSDSGGTTRLHFGEWSDGSVTHVSGVSSGVYNEPMPLAITEWNMQIVEPREQEVNVVDGSITGSHVNLWGGIEAPGWADDTAGAILDAAEVLPDA